MTALEQMRSRSTFRTCLLFCVSAVTSSALHAATAQAQERQSPFSVLPLLEDEDEDVEKTVNELMRTGVTAYRKKNFEAAREAFAKAWQIRPHVDIASTLAEVEMRLGRYREAAEHWEYNLKHSAADRDEASAQLAECRKHLGRVHVEVNLPDAIVFVDGVLKVDDTQINRELAFWLDPGEHIFAARKGGQGVEVRVSVLAGEAQTIQLSVPTPSLVEATPTPVAVTPFSKPTPPQDRNSGGGPSSRTVVVASGAALTVAALGLGVYSHLRAESAEARRLELVAQAQAQLPVPTRNFCSPRTDGGETPSQCPEIASKADEAFTFENVRNVSFIAGGALGVATVATYLLWPRARRQAEQA